MDVHVLHIVPVSIYFSRRKYLKFETGSFKHGFAMFALSMVLLKCRHSLHLCNDLRRKHPQ